MSAALQLAAASWNFPVALTLVLFLPVPFYFRGWLRLRSSAVDAIPLWRAISFLIGIFFLWLALASPLSTLDDTLLTAHMLQHLLLMTFAPPLLWLGAPVMPFLHGLPQWLVRKIIGPILHAPAIQKLGAALVRPSVALVISSAALIGWHIPSAFTLGLESESWHIVEHTTFLFAGLIFWWPVIQPWPSQHTRPRWPILLYLFLATLPCDVLSAFLVFSDRIVYPVYLATSRPAGFSVLSDQQLAGSLMWTCISILYLIPAAILTVQLLSSNPGRRLAPSKSFASTAQTETTSLPR
jgi:cytochrome c oxidase assembly factor CtaG